MVEKVENLRLSRRSKAAPVEIAQQPLQKARIEQEEMPPGLEIDLTFLEIVVRRRNRAIGFS